MKKIFLLIFTVLISLSIFALPTIEDLKLDSKAPENGFVTLEKVNEEKDPGYFSVNGWVYEVSEDDQLYELAGSVLTEESLTVEQIEKISGLTALGPLVIEWEEFQTFSDTVENRDQFIYDLLNPDNPIAFMGIFFKNLPGFNGETLKPISVAAFAKVYNVGELSKWRTGTHYNRHSSGEELTYALVEQAPHSVSNLDRAKLFAILIVPEQNVDKILESESNYERVNNTIVDRRVEVPIAYIAH